MKDDVNRTGTGEALLRDIATEAAAAFNAGPRQVRPFSARYPDLTMDDVYRVTALANEMRVAKGYRPVGRKIGFTNRRMHRSGALSTIAPCTTSRHRCRSRHTASRRSSR